MGRDVTALVLCGGRGTRLDADVEKPLVRVGGRPMVDRVLSALAASRAGPVQAVTSPHAPRTREHLDCPTIDAPGEGYVADLAYALDRVDTPVLTVAADLPLLDGTAVDAVLDAHAGRSLAAYVPADRKRELDLSVDGPVQRAGRELVAAGVNLVGGDRNVRSPDTENRNGRDPAAENRNGRHDGTDDTGNDDHTGQATGKVDAEVIRAGAGGDRAATTDGTPREDTFITRDRRLAVNVNRIEDRRVAEAILEGRQ